jgi:hypothetical protein
MPEYWFNATPMKANFKYDTWSQNAQMGNPSSARGDTKNPPYKREISTSMARMTVASSMLTARHEHMFDMATAALFASNMKPKYMPGFSYVTVLRLITGYVMAVNVMGASNWNKASTATLDKKYAEQ